LNLKHGMLINFKVALMKDGIHRVFNNFSKEEPGGYSLSAAYIFFSLLSS